MLEWKLCLWAKTLMLFNYFSHTAQHWNIFSFKLRAVLYSPHRCLAMWYTQPLMGIISMLSDWATSL